LRRYIKVEYFQVSGTFDPKKPNLQYSFKMPVTIWNKRYDLHGSFFLDPAQLIGQFFSMCWKFIEAGGLLRTSARPTLNILLLLRAYGICMSIHPEGKSCSDIGRACFQ